MPCRCDLAASVVFVLVLSSVVSFDVFVVIGLIVVYALVCALVC